LRSFGRPLVYILWMPFAPAGGELLTRCVFAS
jgi:hypothetical protein